MPSTKTSRFFKSRRKSTTDGENKTLQPSHSQSTLSKFFAFNPKRGNDGTDQSLPVKRQKTEIPKLHSTELMKETDAVEIESNKNDASVERIRDRLQSFAASPDSEYDQIATRSVKVFDYHILQREKAATLPDINLMERRAKEGVVEAEDLIESCSKDLNNKPDDDINIDDFGDVSSSSYSSNKGKHITKNSTSGQTYDKSNTSVGTSRLGKRASSTSKVKYTQLEQQFLEIKQQHPDAVLFVECGYKYRFFGEDAEIAGRVLKIYAHLDHNFMTASIPIHRLFVHVRRLVSAGFKVGVVKQTETAALKAAGTNKSAPFTRELTALYTKATLMDDNTVSEDVPGDPVTTETNYLMVICDNIQDKVSKKTTIGIIAVQPSTGDVVYDSFEDSDSRPELEARLCHLQPVEIIMSRSVSPLTHRLVNSLISVSEHGDDRLRLEQTDPTHYEYSTAFRHVTDFYTTSSQSVAGSTSLDKVLSLPAPVLGCLSALIHYLSDFRLDSLLADVSTFSQFTSQAQYMELGASTLRNLEVFTNCTDGRPTGSLFWSINHTVTRPGARLLRKWLSQPLLDYVGIVSRQDAVQDLLGGGLSQLSHLRGIMGRLPDLERALTAAYHKKCSPSEFFHMSRALESLYHALLSQRDALSSHLSSKLLQEIITDTVEHLADISDITRGLNEAAAKANDKQQLFQEGHVPVEMRQVQSSIGKVLQEIQEHRRHVRLTVRQPALEYTTVLGTEFLIEVKNVNLDFVPKDWVKISSTKSIGRFHSPFIAERYKTLQQLREQLILASDKAWGHFLEEFVCRYQQYRRAVSCVSQLDCLMSLTISAQQEGYCRPEILKDAVCLEIEAGRHPVVQQLLGESQQYVANDTHLTGDGERVMIVTGPNMGGKSCYIRQVALLSLLAQIGAYIPAAGARLGIVEAIFTRMGAADEIYRSRSTFMVELQEASDIMAKVTSRPKSLVILDELGRGTSTHDGVAIAHATLEYFINQAKCLTLFVTHYPSLCELAQQYPDHVTNYHMAFLVQDNTETADSADDKITFLYQLAVGSADRSYGLNVAKLADLPADICSTARHKSLQMEEKMLRHRKSRELFLQLFKTTGQSYCSLLLGLESE